MLIDEAFCSFVLNEVKLGEVYSLTWALALAQAEGNERHAQALYVKLRVEELRRKWLISPLSKVPEGLAFGKTDVFHKGMLIPYSDIVSIVLYSNCTQWAASYRVGDNITTSRSFLFRLATQYHVIEFSKLCLFGFNAKEYESLFRTFMELADGKIIPRLAQPYLHRLTQQREKVTIAGIQIDPSDGIRATTLGFQKHLPPERFYGCRRDYYCSEVYIKNGENHVWKRISCKEPNAVLLLPVINAIYGGARSPKQ